MESIRKLDEILKSRSLLGKLVKAKVIRPEELAVASEQAAGFSPGKSLESVTLTSSKQQRTGSNKNLNEQQKRVQMIMIAEDVDMEWSTSEEVKQRLAWIDNYQDINDNCCNLIMNDSSLNHEVDEGNPFESGRLLLQDIDKRLNELKQDKLQQQKEEDTIAII